MGAGFGSPEKHCDESRSHRIRSAAFLFAPQVLAARAGGREPCRFTLVLPGLPTCSSRRHRLEAMATVCQTEALETNMELFALHEPAHVTAPPRRYLSLNVIAMWPEERPPVVNPARRGRYPRGVCALRSWKRLRPGVYAYLWNNCLAENRGLVVKLLYELKGRNCPGFWCVQGITGQLAQMNIEDGTAVPGLHLIGTAQDVNLRRCAAPKGANPRPC